MSYEFQENEYVTPEQYLGLMWNLRQIDRRAGHRPANKTVTLDRMYAKLFNEYPGAASISVFATSIASNLNNVDKTAAVSGAVAYFNT